VFKVHRLFVSLNSRLESTKEEKKKVPRFRVSRLRVHGIMHPQGARLEINKEEEEEGTASFLR